MTLHISQPPTQCINSYTDIIPYRVRKLPSIFLFYIPLPHFPFIFLVVMNTQRMLTDSIFLCREETNSISIDIHCAHFLYVSSLVLKIASLELSTDDTHTHVHNLCIVILLLEQTSTVKDKAAWRVGKENHLFCYYMSLKYCWCVRIFACSVSLCHCKAEYFYFVILVIYILLLSHNVKCVVSYLLVSIECSNLKNVFYLQMKQFSLWYSRG